MAIVRLDCDLYGDRTRRLRDYIKVVLAPASSTANPPILTRLVDAAGIVCGAGSM